MSVRLDPRAPHAFALLFSIIGCSVIIAATSFCQGAAQVHPKDRTAIGVRRVPYGSRLQAAM